jgi:FHS family L-fucose permease-like MFS transporter
MFFLFAMIAFVTGLQNPFGIVVKEQFGASNAMSQLGNAANFIAYAFLGLPAGFILKRRGYKVTALMAVAIGFIGVGITYLSGIVGQFWVYLLGAFVSGFSMCMLNTVVNPMLNTLGGGGNRGNQLIQLGGSMNSLAATIVPVLVGYLIAGAAKATIADVNPALYIAMGVFALAFIIILFSAIPEPELEAAKASMAQKEAEEGTFSLIKGALSHKNLVFGLIAIFLYVGIEVGIPNTMNNFLTTATDAAQPGFGMDKGAAGAVVAIYWLLMLVGRLIGGAIGGNVSSRTMIAIVSSVAMALISVGVLLPGAMVKFPSLDSQTFSFSLVEIPVGVMLFVLCGLCTSVMWGAIFNLAVEGLGKYTSIASGLFMVMVCGGGILPLVQGAVVDLAGFMNSYWVLVVALAYIFWFGLIGSRTNK